jgi:hypothetical protein
MTSKISRKSLVLPALTLMKIEYLGKSESDEVQKWEGGGGKNKMTGRRRYH